MLLSLIAEKRRQPAEEARRDVVGAIVHARDDRGQSLSDEQILAHVNILLVAGHETTTTLAAQGLHKLALHPEWRIRLEAELARLRESGADEDGELGPDALRAAHDLDNFVKETGRLYPPVLNVPRGVVKDFEFAGYHVPAGTPVRLALAAGHLLPDVFADPERFDPDRFAPPREEDRRPYALVTFGGGPRICIGIIFAQVEVKALLAHVLARYDLEAVDREVVHAGHWTAILPDGVRLRVRSR
jgi:cytochrome P450